MEIIKKNLVGLVIGICLTVTVGSVYFAYKANKNAVAVWEKVVAHETALQQIITFLNQATKPQ